LPAVLIEVEILFAFSAKRLDKEAKLLAGLKAGITAQIKKTFIYTNLHKYALYPPQLPIFAA
jgi:hypothetical protein